MTATVSALRGVAPDVAATLPQGLPSARDENWKYANLRALERLSFASPLAPSGAERAATLAHLPPALAHARRVVLLDGLPIDPVPPWSHAVAIDGLRVGAAEPERPADTAIVPADQRFARINRSLTPVALQIELSADAQACVEVVIVSYCAGAQGSSQPQIRVTLQTGAQLTLVQRFVCADTTAAWSNVLTDVRLGANAVCQHYRMQQSGDRAYLHESLNVELDRDAEYRHRSVDTGAGWSRLTASLRLVGSGAAVQWVGVDAVSGTQQHDTSLHVEHIGAATRTQQTFRGIAADRGRLACNGHMVVRESARGAVLAQSLRSLLAGPGCEANLRPQLEIYTDDVRASHGATAGTVDEAMRFYLMSRGLDSEAAGAILKWAFLEDGLSRIELPELRRYAEEVVARRIGLLALHEEMT